jgi:hypothetical protein
MRTVAGCLTNQRLGATISTLCIVARKNLRKTASQVRHLFTNLRVHDVAAEVVLMLPAGHAVGFDRRSG